MSVYRYKRSKVWTMDFVFHAQRIRESTGTSSKTLAQKIEAKRRRDLEEGTAGIKKSVSPKAFAFAAADWLELKKGTLAPSSISITKGCLAHLLPVFGKMLLCDIGAHDVSRYQKTRTLEGAAPKTVNLEIGTLRAVLKRNGQWERILPDMKMLAVNEDVGIAISETEEAALLAACAQSRSRLLLPFVTLAIETGARYGVIRTLQWGAVDLEGRFLRWGKDKTVAGTGRVVPLNGRAADALKLWAESFPDRKPTDYVFPAERCAAEGDDFTAMTYATDPTKPIGSIKEAWEGAKKRAGKILDTNPTMGETAPPLKCRFHDLRHTAVSRMLKGKTPLPLIAKIVGWSPSTMVKMAARYGHFSLDELRGAADLMSSNSPVFIRESPVNPPVRRRLKLVG